VPHRRVEVGRSGRISIVTRDGEVDFAVRHSVALTEGSGVIGGRTSSEIVSGSGGERRRYHAEARWRNSLTQNPARTGSRSMIGGFRPLFRAVDPGQVMQLTGN